MSSRLYMLVGTPAPANRGPTPCRPSTIPKSEPETMPKDSGTSAKERPAGDTATDAGVLRFHGVRYQVKDVSRSADFYSRHLGFKVEHQRVRHVGARAARSVAERARGIGIASAAGRSRPDTWRIESHRVANERSAVLDREAEI